MILVVGGTPELMAICQRAAVLSAGDAVLPAAVDRLATIAAQCRPAVMVIPDEHFKQDEEELIALARDVKGRIVVVPEGVSDEVLLAPVFKREFTEAAAARNQG